MINGEHVIKAKPGSCFPTRVKGLVWTGARTPENTRPRGLVISCILTPVQTQPFPRVGKHTHKVVLFYMTFIKRPMRATVTIGTIPYKLEHAHRPQNWILWDKIQFCLQNWKCSILSHKIQFCVTKFNFVQQNRSWCTNSQFCDTKSIVWLQNWFCNY